MPREGCQNWHNKNGSVYCDQIRSVFRYQVVMHITQVMAGVRHGVHGNNAAHWTREEEPDQVKWRMQGEREREGIENKLCKVKEVSTHMPT